MALVVYDRVQETTATTGTGTITLGGAVAGYQSFAVVGNGNTTFYCIVNSTAWEVGIGTYTSSGTTLDRTTVLSNSNGNTSPITLSGVSNVFVTYPASKSINYDANGVATIGTTLSYSDTGIVGSFASTVAGYNQVIIQNKSSATNASSNLNVSNDASTSTTGFVELGVNSSTFTGTGSFSIAGASYLASASTDLVIGTYGAYSLRFVTNSNTTDAMTIYNSGGVSLGGYADPGIGTLYANNIYLGFNAITAAAGTTVLTNASAGYQNVTGTTTQTIQLPVATTLYKGLAFTIANASTGAVTIKDSASTTLDTIVTGGTAIMVLTANATSAGTWVAYSYLPSTYDFSSTSANFGNATITNAVWNGTTIASGYGGTGLTTFTAANNALYSTSASALAAGTLPIAAGGTAATTFTANGVLYGNGTSALGVTAAGTTGQVLQANTGGAPTWATTYAGTVTSVAQSFTGGLISVAGSPITTSGTLALTVAGTSGGIPYFSSASTWATSAALAANALMVGGGAGVAPSTITTGTGVNTALGVAVGSAGAFVTNGGALGTPSSGTVTNLTGTASININGTVGATTANTGAFTTVSASGVITSTVVTGTAPFTVASTTQVANLNAATAGTAAGLSATLVVGSGGTGTATAPTAGSVVYGASTSAQGYTAVGTSGQVLVSGAAGSPTWTTNIAGNAANVTGTVAIANGGTGQTTAAAAFNALNPMTTTGDIIYEASPTTAARLGIGSTGQVLTVAGGLPSWAAAPSSNITTLGLYENSATISANYTIGTGNNAMSAGPITVNTGVTVTVPTGSTWVIV